MAGPPPRHAAPPLSLALLEIGNLTPALLAADRRAEAAGVRILADVIGLAIAEVA